MEQIVRKKINLDTYYLSGLSKKAKHLIFIRNKELKRLQEIIKKLTKENIRLKDEIMIYKSGEKRKWV